MIQLEENVREPHILKIFEQSELPPPKKKVKVEL